MWLIDLKSISYQKEIKEVQEQISSISTKIVIKKEENGKYRNIITGMLYINHHAHQSQMHQKLRFAI